MVGEFYVHYLMARPLVNKALLVNVFILGVVWEIFYKGQSPIQYIYGAEKFFEISRSTALRLSS